MNSGTGIQPKELEMLLFSAINTLLEEIPVQGKIVDSILVTVNDIILIDENYQIIGKLVETVGKIDSQVAAKEICDSICKVRIKDTYDSNGNKESKKYILGDTNTFFIGNETQNTEEMEKIISCGRVYGAGIAVKKRIVYFEDCYESQKDKRRDEFKLALFQADSRLDFAAHMLIKHGYSEGFLDEKHDLTYGKSRGTTSMILLGRRDAVPTGYARSLKFVALGLHITKDQIASEGIASVKVPSVSQLSLRSDLKTSLKANKGIILLNKFHLQDLTQSDFIDEADEFETIGCFGSMLPTRSTYKLNINLMTKRKGWTDAMMIESMDRVKYKFLVDNSDYFNWEEIVKVADNQLIIIAGDLSDISSYFKRFNLINPDIKNAFINRLIYMGDIYKSKGTKITNMLREQIKSDNFTVINYRINGKTTLNQIIETIMTRYPGTNIIYNREKDIIADIDGKAVPLQGFVYEDPAALEFIARNTDKRDEDAEKLIEEKGRYTLILEIPISENDVMEMKCTVYKSYDGYQFQAQPKIKANPSAKRTDINPNDYSLILVVAPTKGGKTTFVKNNIDINENDKVYILDEDFDFSTREYSIAKTVLMDREGLNISNIQRFGPTKLIINSNISEYELVKLIALVGDSMQTWITLNPYTYNTALNLGLTDYIENSGAKALQISKEDLEWQRY